MTAGATGDEAAWGWVAHLRAGGTRTWRDWRAAPEPVLVGAPDAALPGAQHLELARRLNLIAPRPALVDRVLGTAAPGRGDQELPLPGVGGAEFGVPAREPDDVDPPELLRLASGVLAELVAHAALPAGPARAGALARVRARKLPAVRVIGDRWTAPALRRQARAAGRRVGGDDATVVLLVGDLGRQLAGAWADRVRHGGVHGWGRWITRLAGHPLPPQHDPAALAALWADRVGVERVHVVVDPAAAADLLGVPNPVVPERLSHAALDVVQRTRPVLKVMLDEAAREDRIERVLVPLLASLPSLRPEAVRLPEVAVPRRHRGWLTGEAERVREGLAAGGYPVLGGDLDRVLPAEPERTQAPDASEVLAVMVSAVAAAAEGETD